MTTSVSVGSFVRNWLSFLSTRISSAGTRKNKPTKEKDTNFSQQSNEQTSCGKKTTSRSDPDRRCHGWLPENGFMSQTRH